jgi:chorismate synthase
MQISPAASPHTKAITTTRSNAHTTAAEITLTVRNAETERRIAPRKSRVPRPGQGDIVDLRGP